MNEFQKESVVIFDLLYFLSSWLHVSAICFASSVSGHAVDWWLRARLAVVVVVVRVVIVTIVIIVRNSIGSNSSNNSVVVIVMIVVNRLYRS